MSANMIKSTRSYNIMKKIKKFLMLLLNFCCILVYAAPPIDNDEDLDFVQAIEAYINNPDNSDHIKKTNERRDIVLNWLSEGCAIEKTVCAEKIVSSLAVDKKNPDVNDSMPIAQAHTQIECTNEIKSALGEILTDVKGNGNDPFVKIFGTHCDQDAINGIGYKGNIYGVLGGLDYKWNIGNNGNENAVAGAMLGLAQSRTTFNCENDDNGMWGQQNMYICGLFAAYENSNQKLLKTNFNIFAGLNYAKNELWRTDDNNTHYSTDFNSQDWFINVEAVKNLFKFSGWQTGPYAGIEYNYIRQDGHKESGNSANAIDISAANYHLLDTTIGLNIEKEWQDQANSERRLRIYGRFGWDYQVIRDANGANAKIDGGDPFRPYMSYLGKNSFLCTLGLRYQLNSNWDVNGSYAGNFSKTYNSHNINFGVGYTF